MVPIFGRSISCQLSKTILRRVVLLTMNGTNGSHNGGSHNGTTTTTTVNDDGMSQPKVLFVLGGPGAGKGTQCNYLVEQYGYVHLSAGDLLRAERDSGSADGAMINDYIKDGKIVPVKVTVSLLEKAMINNKGGTQKFLIDGFPRNENNLQGWVSHMTGKADVEGVLFFDCPEEVCVQRILERAKTSNRVDDNEESIRKRFKTYYNETMPVITYYKKLNLVETIDATPQVDKVFKSVQAYMEKQEVDSCT